jgi:hypothetical protein
MRHAFCSQQELDPSALTRSFGLVKRSRSSSSSRAKVKPYRKKPEKTRETMGDLFADIGDELI